MIRLTFNSFLLMEAKNQASDFVTTLNANAQVATFGNGMNLVIAGQGLPTSGTAVILPETPVIKTTQDGKAYIAYKAKHATLGDITISKNALFGRHYVLDSVEGARAKMSELLCRTEGLKVGEHYSVENVSYMNSDKKKATIAVAFFTKEVPVSFDTLPTVYTPKFGTYEPSTKDSELESRSDYSRIIVTAAAPKGRRS